MPAQPLPSTAAPATLFDALLAAMATGDPRRPVINDVRGQAESLRGLLTKALALGRLLGRLSQPGETVGLLLPNVVTTVSAIYGLSGAGRVPAMLNYSAGPRSVRAACHVAGIRLVISSRQFVEQAGLASLIAQLGADESLQLCYLEDLRKAFGWRDKCWLLGWARHFPRRAFPPGDPARAAVILFTSGSEGEPKGVALSHGNLLANVAQIRAVINFGADDCFFVALPLFHAFGFTCGAILPLLAGARLHLHTSPLHYHEIPALVRQHGATVLFGTSTFLGHYARHAGSTDFSSLRYVVAGAEKLAPAVRERWASQFGIDILEGYGTTECSPVLAVNTPDAQRHGSVGHLLPGIDHRLVGVEGISNAWRLQVRGPNIMCGYLLPDAPGQLQPPADGWYDTGDLVRFDADGFLYLAGRLRRFAKVGGEMVSLDSVEAIARHARPEGQHASVALDDVQRGQRILLFSTADSLTRQILSESAHALGLPLLALPRQIVAIAALPLLGSGKVDYPALQALAEQAGGSAGDAPA